MYGLSAPTICPLHKSRGTCTGESYSAYIDAHARDSVVSLCGHIVGHFYQDDNRNNSLPLEATDSEFPPGLYQIARHERLRTICPGEGARVKLIIKSLNPKIRVSGGEEGIRHYLHWLEDSGHGAGTSNTLGSLIASGKALIVLPC